MQDINGRAEDASKDVLLPGEAANPSRRAFLQMAGYGIGSALLSGCSRGPVQQVVPYLTAPTGVVPGRAYWLATSCHGCAAGCGVLAKCRDGRPVKLEGNNLDLLTRGGLCAVGQAEVLSLYDSLRATVPTHDGVERSWKEIDEDLGKLVADIRGRGGRIRLLTGSIHSPSTLAMIEKFSAAGGDVDHVSYDALSVSAILDSHQRSHGLRALPRYRFDQAEVIASFDADFLGTWISPVSFAAEYAAGRRPETGHMSRHHQFEARLSLTGSAADRRTELAPWEVNGALAGLCELLEKGVGATPRMSGRLETSGAKAAIEELADELLHARGRSLVVCGVNEVETQLLVNYANELLGNYGTTLSLARPSLQRSGDDGALLRLAEEVNSGTVDLLIVSGVNPAYDLPGGASLVLSKAKALAVHSSGLDETWALGAYGLPASHPLESWDDGEPVRGRYTMTQPAVPSLRQGRTLRRVLAGLMGDEREDADLLRDHWLNALHGELAPGTGFESFYDRLLHDGYLESPDQATAEPRFLGDVPVAVAETEAQPPEGLRLVLYPKIGLHDGRHAHNPWLQEMPDPVTRVTWDNYASLSVSRAEQLGVTLGDPVRITAGELSIELPVLIQRGQHDDVVAVALGYGRIGTDRFSDVAPEWWEGKPTIEKGQTIGVNAAPLLAFLGGNLRSDVTDVQVEKLGGHVELALTQDHHTLEIPEHLAPRGHEVRGAVHTASLETYRGHPADAIHLPHIPEAELWPDDHEKKGYHWGIAVDLSVCNGCSACTISCQAENNVPVVGRDEVLRHREMHWLRVDRYLAGEDGEVTAAYQPMFCQQCDHAPCESVCPVLATVHSDEGLNQQVYNRCVGTRYCANTCPYKARRFNWFDYPREDRLQNHSLNPDVTIRSRGVMEKCTFCAQRIQEAKSEAVRRGVELADGDIQVACQQSCPTRAIVFGDMNDPESEVSKLMDRQRAYGVMAELNVKPSVRYLARIRNVKNTTSQEEHHG